MRSNPMIFVSILALCVAPGCRKAREGDRERGCPPEEVCSPDVEGLRFLGSHGDGVAPTAVGGRHTIRVEGWSGAFDAAVGGDAFEIVEGSGGLYSGRVVVRGLRPGRAHLRVLHPRTGELLDRTSLEVREAIEIGFFERDTSYLAFDGVGRRVRVEDAVIVAGGEATLEVNALADGVVVDEGLRVGGVERGSVTVTGPSSGAARVEAETSAGLASALELPAVTAVDDIAVVEGPGEGTTELVVGQTATACFSARSGGRRALGAALTFELSGGLEHALGEPDGDGPQPCARLVANAAGPAELAVRGPGAVRTLSFRVVERAAAP